MDKYQKELQATQLRVEARIKYEKTREEKTKEGYFLYLAYTKLERMK